MNHAPKTANATYCATLCDQLWVDGLTTAFIAPGSRSTPLALALVAHHGIAVEVFHDERSAAFAALGHGLATGTPALVLCSSGTAGAHFYGAVIEADASAVPLIVVTADRPPELWDRGAPQTIDQSNLYGHRVRDFVEPGPPDEVDPATWRAIARRLWLNANGATPGPVHANLSFRDPLTGTPDSLPESIAALDTGTDPVVDHVLLNQVADLLRSERGVIIAGRTETHPDDVLQLAATLGWPVLCDHRSKCRAADSPNVIGCFDSLLRDRTFAESQRPDVVVRIGEIVSSKAVSQWLTASAEAGSKVVSTRPHGRHIDPEDIATVGVDEAGFVATLVAKLDDSMTNPRWLASWTAANQAARVATSAVVEVAGPNEITVAQACVASVPTGGALFMSSSMPVRDVEWFGADRSDIDVYANRGANGIDGIVASSIGVALSGQPTLCLIGDVAFLHDSSSLIALRDRHVDLTIVVTDNDGGGIFSFLPQHQLLDRDTYERLFGTPHGTDLAALAQSHGLMVEMFDDSIAAPDGVRVVIASSDRQTNLDLHDRAHDAVAAALRDAGQ